MNEETSAISFPCAFPIKAMGYNSGEFDSLVVGLVRRHDPGLREGAVTTRLSRRGKYMSVTVTVQAVSQQQLDDIYKDLSAHAKVLMAL